MSSTLYWRPTEPPAKNSLGTGMKFVLREYLGCNPLDCTMDAGSIPFLRGIELASSDDHVSQNAHDLIAAIERHGEIRVWEQY